ncbi:MAG: 2-dehydro-3-deoxy-6-phosphogalactonate aldolase [Xanthomonadales bacterium]|nr:2-dehydro-3-deoxy-6-phosphogalactonate aldolase [Xanthomonadales bacterium]
MKKRFLRKLNEMPLIGIFRGITPEEAEAIVGAAIENGILIAEVPLNSPDPLLSIERLVKRFGDDVIVGAGTVTTVDDVIAVANSGGQIVVTPYARRDVVKKAKELGLAAVSGALTPTEIAEMHDCGADAVKVFPAEMVSPMMIRAMRAVLPKSLPLIPVGGINIENMADYLNAGANGFGLGSALYRKGDSAVIVAENVATFVRRMKELSGS